MVFNQIVSLHCNQLWSSIIPLSHFIEKDFANLSEDQKYQVLVMVADAYFETKEWKLAEMKYSKALQIKRPKSAKTLSSDHERDVTITEEEVKYKLHLCHMKNGNESQALELLMSIPQKQRSPKCEMALGNLHKLTNSPGKLAISSFREVLRSCPMALDAAQQLLNLGVKPLEIQEITLEAISDTSFSEWFIPWAQSYSSFVNGGDRDSNMNLLRPILDLPSCRSNITVLHLNAMIEYFAGNDKMAMGIFQKMHKLEPKNLRGMEILAALYAKERRLKDLEQLALQLMSVSEDFPEPWVAMGYFAYVTKKTSKALYFAHKALLVDRQCVEAYILKGSVLLDIKKLQDAVLHFRDAESLSPYRYEAHKGLVYCYLALSRNREAVTVAVAATKQLKNAPRALTLWATALYKDPLQLYWDRAKNILEKALIKDPHYLPAAYVLADIAEHEKNIPTAIELLRNQVGHHSSSKLHKTLADLLVKNNDHEQALEHYRFALAHNHRNQGAKDGLLKIEQSSDGNYDTSNAGVTTNEGLSKKCKALCHFSHILQDVPSVMDHDDVDDIEEEEGGEVGDEMEDCDSETHWPDDLN